MSSASTSIAVEQEVSDSHQASGLEYSMVVCNAGKSSLSGRCFIRGWLAQRDIDIIADMYAPFVTEA